MIFTETQLKGAFIIDVQRMEDERGFFARTFCQHEFQRHGLPIDFVQGNISYNKKKGTLRGMHLQVPPYEEGKLIRCSRGAIYDVLIDLRSQSDTFQKWIGVELTSANYRQVYIPKGFAHGFITLEDDTEIVYNMTQFYTPGTEKGFHWNDPAFSIHWPIEPTVISEKDRSYPFVETNLLASK